ncbi:hypothetical protein [Paraburkholderia sp. MM5477-R1]|uniref:hypothetical protein n=1 Tax=Paraburkholderia sp. MM5477-R1 TaxID=2991062 RepID=UPI003D24C405
MIRSDLLTDTLILISDADDWTPLSRWERWRDIVEKHGHTVRLIASHARCAWF